MNREERRRQSRSRQKDTAKESLRKLIWSTIKGGAAPQDLREGDHVQIDVASIERNPDYTLLSEKYKKFIHSNAGTVFTVRYDRRYKDNPHIVCLKEDINGWLFWTGNLIKIE